MGTTMTITVTSAQTYAGMLETLRVRCGLHATLGNAPALNDILTEAHEYVYAQLNEGYPVTSTLTLVADTATYPSVSDDSVSIVRGSIQTVWIEQGSTERHELPQGITHAMRADTAMRGIPECWDSQYAGTDDGVWTMEFWPTPDQEYTVYIDHQRVLTRFSSDADVPAVDYRLVLGYAVAMGKAHYSRPDADAVGQAFKTLLYQAKVEQKENRRFIPPSARRDARPRVVSTTGGFRQVWD
jgi:hypothetical protein